MKIWLIKEGEPLPCDESPRLMRMGLLAQFLCKNGHDVTWWSSSFEHGKKKDRTDHTEVRNMFGTGKLVLLYSKDTYKKNISLSRITYHRNIARTFKEMASESAKPDIIFCAFPTLDFAEEAVKYGREKNVPVIVDVRDLWPDIFVRAIPKPLRFMSKVLLASFQRKTNWIFNNATAITAINPSHLQWAMNRLTRPKTCFDRSIFFGYQKAELSNKEREAAVEFWDNLGVTNKTWNICYIGTMSPMTLDMETVISGFHILSEKYSDMRLVLCGEGDGLAGYKDLSSKNTSIIFPGWIDKKQISILLERSKIGLYPFHNLPDFINSFTNKIIEYFSGAVPAITCLTGFSRDFIINNGVGYIYQEGDANDFSKVIEFAYVGKNDREQMSKNAIACYENNFTDEISNIKFAELFSEIVQDENKKGEELK